MLLLLACARAPDPAPPVPPPPAAPPAALPALAPPAPRFTAVARPLTPPEREAMTPSVWREGCPVPLDALRHLEIAHRRPDGSPAVGVLVVAAEAVDPLTAALHTLWDQGFPIERMQPVEAFGGDDTRSMEANNTSAFNCRPKTGASGWSRHSYGTAVDVNPLWNPWVKPRPGAPGGVLVAPEAGRPWVDRTRTDPGVLHAGDPAVRAFADVGWRWGGGWSSLRDYQHFSDDGT